MTEFRVRNKFSLIAGPEYVMLDLFKFRIVYQWVSSEDGITPLPWKRRLYGFRRGFNY